MRPRLWIFLLLVCLPACFLWRPERRPNLLLIVVDSLRFDAISRSLGSARAPSLHALADEGVAFPWCFAHTSDPLASHTSLLSARAPGDTGAVGSRVLPADLPLVAGWLAQKGYRTVGVVSLPDLVESPEPGVERGFATFERLRDRGAAGDRGQEPSASAIDGAARAADVNATLLPHLARVAGGAPWFALVQYSEPARPYGSYGTEASRATATLDGKLLDTFEIGEGAVWSREVDLAPGRHELVLASQDEFVVTGAEGSALVEPPAAIAAELAHAARRAAPAPVRSRRFVLVNAEDRVVRSSFAVRVHDVPAAAQARQRYKLEIEAVDRAIAEVLDELRRTDQYDDTVIVLTADHGASLGEHPRIAETANLHDEILRVPLIVKPTKDDRRLADLTRSKYTLVRHIDVVPTALDLIDVRPLPGARGTSLFVGAQRTLLAEAYPPVAASTVLAMRDERYKLVYDADRARFEFYDLRVDTLEVDNVFEVQGHLRSVWQTELEERAERAPESVRLGGARVENAGAAIRGR